MISVSDGDFDAVFPNRSTDGYIVVDSLPVSELSEFTVSLWAKAYTCLEKHTLLIYSSQSYEKGILFTLEKSSTMPSVCKLSVIMKDVEYVAFLLLAKNANVTIGYLPYCTVERFSTTCRKTKTKVISVSHKGHRRSNDLINS